MIFRLLAIHPSLTDKEKKTIIRKTVSEQVHRAAPDLMLSRLVLFLFVCLLFVVVVVVVEFGLFFCTYIDFKTIIFLFLFPFSAGNGNTGNHVTAAARTGGRYSPFHYYFLLSSLVLLFILVIILFWRNFF